MSGSDHGEPRVDDNSPTFSQAVYRSSILKVEAEYFIIGEAEEYFGISSNLVNSLLQEEPGQGGQAQPLLHPGEPAGQHRGDGRHPVLLHEN